LIADLLPNADLEIVEYPWVQSAISNRKSAIRLSISNAAISNQQSAIENQQSALQSAISNRKSAILMASGLHLR
jgi:hypothetical protein